MLEQTLVALAWGYQWGEWEQLDTDEQAMCIAAIRAKDRIAAVMDHDAQRRSKISSLSHKAPRRR